MIKIWQNHGENLVLSRKLMPHAPNPQAKSEPRSPYPAPWRPRPHQGWPGFALVTIPGSPARTILPRPDARTGASPVDEGWNSTAVLNFGVLKRIQTPHSLTLKGFWLLTWTSDFHCFGALGVWPGAQTRPHVRACHMGVIIAIVEPLS